MAASAGLHLAAAVALVQAVGPAAAPAPTPAPPVLLLPPPSPTPSPAPVAAVSAAKPAPPPPLRNLATVALALRDPRPLPRSEAATEGAGVEPSDALLAGAQGAEGASAGRPCGMARRLEAALRRDALVQAAAAGAGGRPLLVWNGEWVAHGAEDGKGLAAVREAILWEVGFAPEACRNEAMRGLVLLALGEGAAPRLALGSAAWRWCDLLAATPILGEATAARR